MQANAGIDGMQKERLEVNEMVGINGVTRMMKTIEAIIQ